jgi:hypothetical protein
VRAKDVAALLLSLGLLLGGFLWLLRRVSVVRRGDLDLDVVDGHGRELSSCGDLRLFLGRGGGDGRELSLSLFVFALLSFPLLTLPLLVVLSLLLVLLALHLALVLLPLPPSGVLGLALCLLLLERLGVLLPPLALHQRAAVLADPEQDSLPDHHLALARLARHALLPVHVDLEQACVVSVSTNTQA